MDKDTVALDRLKQRESISWASTRGALTSAAQIKPDRERETTACNRKRKQLHDARNSCRPASERSMELHGWVALVDGSDVS